MTRTMAVRFVASLVLLGLSAGATPASAQDDPLDCVDYPNQAAAQAAYRDDPTDPANNDADEDGIACELFAYDDAATDLVPVEGVAAPADGVGGATTTAPVAASGNVARQWAGFSASASTRPQRAW